MNIFIGSSKEVHESGILLEIAKIVEECGMVPIRWNKTPSIFKAGKFTLENLEEIIAEKNIVGSIFIYSCDDITWYRGKEVGKPRDNVLFEHGLFSGKLGRTRSIIVNVGNVSMPTDLAGVTYIDFSDGNKTSGEINLREWLKDLKKSLKKSSDKSHQCVNEPESGHLLIRMFKNLKDASPYIVEQAQKASEIKILANKGLEFFGADSSLISLAETEKYKNLKRLKILLLDSNSRWVNRGFMALRKYESIEDFKRELDTTHAIIEMGMRKFIKELDLPKSGIKYHKGEPYFRLIMIDDMAFVSSYAENPTKQVRDLPVFLIKKDFGSLYGSFRKHFNDYWKNYSDYGETFKENIDIEVSAGGIVYWKQDQNIYIVLVQREDGSWVLPKGHKKINDRSLEKTAIREVKEETGLSSKKLRCVRELDSYTYDETAAAISVSKINHFFLIEYVSDEMDDLHADFEHMSAKWWNINEELPFMFYIYQKILISETLKCEFDVDALIDDK